VVEATVLRVEPLQMPPLVRYQGDTPAFLLAWRRGESWEGRLAVPQSHRDVRGEPVHGLNYRWAAATDFAGLPGVDYGAVPRPAEGEPQPLRLPPMVLLKGGGPAFLLAWQSIAVDGRTRWEACLAVPPAPGEPLKVGYVQIGASAVTKLPEVDYSAVPAPGRTLQASS
jgi:hypothetical protein